MNRKFVTSVLIFAAVAMAFLLGAYFAANNIWPIHQLRTIKRAMLGQLAPRILAPEFDKYGRFVDKRKKTEIDCPGQNARTAVLLLIGQSNSGNFAAQKHRSEYGKRIVNYFEGRCYISESPLLGASGGWGESWTLLANKLIAAGYYDVVVLVSAGVGAGEIDTWAKGGASLELLMNVLDRIGTRYAFTHILWHHGESDFRIRTSSGDYRTYFASLEKSIRRRGISAPIFVSIATKCMPDWYKENPVAKAQAMLPDGKSVFQGPNTDELVSDWDRYDDCHFSATGQEKFAARWIEIITAESNNKNNNRNGITR